jgi:AcrR family transcriptional regulator
MNRTSTNTAKRNSKPTFIEEARRRQILDIALDEITAKGYRNTTVKEIANKANITKGVIYYHFKGREELLGSIWSSLVDELFEYRRARVEIHATARDKLCAYVAANFQFLNDNLNKFSALFRMGIDINAAEAGPNPWSDERNRRCRDYLSAILEEGQKRGEFTRFSSDIIATIIQGAIDGLILQGISNPAHYRLEACQKALLDIIERYTAPPGGMSIKRKSR